MSEKRLSRESSLPLFRVLKQEVPETEVKPKQTRRRLTASYKQRILKAADECSGRGELGAMLRREGLYYAQLSKWRKQLASGEGLKEARRGRKSSGRNPEDVKLLKKKDREIASLEARLRRAEGLIEVQKKIAEILKS
jgi:transposase-like protein